MRILVIGAKGMLGSELCGVFGTQYETLAWDLEEIDITDRIEARKRLLDARPDLIVNTAAFVDMEACEADPEKAWLVNAVGAQNLALAAAEMDCRLLYISSDYIFDGAAVVPYDEVSRPNPLNQYGRSKLAGEQFCLQACRRAYSVRTAWLFGHAPNNYVQRVLTAADKDGIVRMPSDQVESPTYTRHLASAIRDLIETEAYGVYHITSRQACTRAEFARFVLQESGRGEPVEVVDAKILQRTTARPAYAVLNCQHFELVAGQRLPHWHEAVRAYLRVS